MSDKESQNSHLQAKVLLNMVDIASRMRCEKKKENMNMWITLDSHPSDAPCCMKIIADNGQDILIHQDWDYPSIANTFGWSLKSVQRHKWNCHHSYTDGTIDCKECGLKAGSFIEAAHEWLKDNDGVQAEDPGYFQAD